MISTITQKQADKIAAYLDTHELPKGLGSNESACSIAAINLALTGRLTDEIPACMSRVIGRWIIGIQDAAPHEMRNSPEWKRLTTEKTRAADAAARAYADADAAARVYSYAAARAAAAADAYAAARVYAAAAAASKNFWANVDPAACLARMIEVAAAEPVFGDLG